MLTVLETVIEGVGIILNVKEKNIIEKRVRALLFFNLTDYNNIFVFAWFF